MVVVTSLPGVAFSRLFFSSYSLWKRSIKSCRVSCLRSCLCVAQITLKTLHTPHGPSNILKLSTIHRNTLTVWAAKNTAVDFQVVNSLTASKEDLFGHRVIHSLNVSPFEQQNSISWWHETSAEPTLDQSIAFLPVRWDCKLHLARQAWFVKYLSLWLT